MSSYHDALREKRQELEEGLKDVGRKLLKPPSSTEQLLPLLEKAENLLSKVWQQPPVAVAQALFPLMNALVSDALIQLADANVQVLLASCINELTRISAPEFTYSEVYMKGIFGLFFIALEKLSCESGRNYKRAFRILETMAIVRSCLMLIDTGCDALMIEMFELFFKTISSDQPPILFTYMETIMTLVIQTSNKISYQLLSPLLASVMMNNMNISPVSWELGVNVLKNCAAKLKRVIRKVVDSRSLDLDDYAEIVSSIYRDASSKNNVAAKASAPTTVPSDDEKSKSNDLSKSEPEDSSLEKNTDNGNLSDDENSQGALRGCQHELKNTETRPDHQLEVGDIIGIQQQERDTGEVRKSRGRKPNSLIKPEEGYEDAWVRGCKGCFELPHNDKNQEIGGSTRNLLSQELALSTETGKETSDAFCKKGSNSEKMGTCVSDVHFANCEPPRKRGRPKKKDSITVKKDEEILGDIDIGGKDDLSLQEYDRNKQVRDEIISHKHKSEKVGDKKSRRSPVVNFGEELVGAQIQVWWPKDKTFYPGRVVSFDPLTKKHKVIYEDDMEEILKMSKERWEYIDQQTEQSSLKKEADFPSSSTVPVKTKKKKEKQNEGSPTKQENGDSSKRSKNRTLKRKESGEYSTAKANSIEDDLVDELHLHEKNVSSDNILDGANHAVEPKTGTSAEHAVEPDAEMSISKIAPN